MTLDEAHLILNTKCGETLESVLKVNNSFLLILYPEPLPAPFFMTVVLTNHHNRITSTYSK